GRSFFAQMTGTACGMRCMRQAAIFLPDPPASQISPDRVDGAPLTARQPRACPPNPHGAVTRRGWGILLPPASARACPRSSRHRRGHRPAPAYADLFQGSDIMFGKLKVLAVTGALAASSFGASSAQAAGWIIGLVDGKSIVTIDPAMRKVTAKVDVKGAGPLVGIDVRPADGMLYGVAGDGTIVTIDPKSGQASMKSKMSETLKPGVGATVDFNPVADRLRVMGSDGTSLRVNVDDGKATVDGSHRYKDGDANAGKTPKIVAGAY